jgi:hypothetical protein
VAERVGRRSVCVGARVSTWEDAERAGGTRKTARRHTS